MRPSRTLPRPEQTPAAPRNRSTTRLRSRPAASHFAPFPPPRDATAPEQPIPCRAHCTWAQNSLLLALSWSRGGAERGSAKLIGSAAVPPPRLRCFIPVRRGCRAALWALRHRLGSACPPRPLCAPRSVCCCGPPAPGPALSPLPANQSAEQDEWQAGQPLVWRGGRGAGCSRAAMLGSSGRRTACGSAPRQRGMEPQVELRVTCRGDTRSFLVSDPVLTTWADVEAMVSAPGRSRASWGCERRFGGPAPSLSAARAMSRISQAGAFSAAASVLLLSLTLTFVFIAYLGVFWSLFWVKLFMGHLFFPCELWL